MSSTTDVTHVLTRKPENIAVFTNPDHELWVHKGEIPTAGDNDCIIHVRAAGICGSDIHFWKHCGIGSMTVTGANGLGHESAGVVVGTGKNVTNFKIGDRVAMNGGIPCMKPSCYDCRSDQYNACPDVVFFSTPPYHGTLARYHVHPEAWLHKIPDSMTFEEGSLLEPLAVALTGAEKAGVRLGDPVVICGAGPIGIVSLLAANASGASPIAITDINESRLEIAKKLVPRVRTVPIKLGKSPEEGAKDIIAALGREPKITLECTGVESSVVTAIYASRFGGVVFVIGCGKDFQTLPLMHMAGKEIELKFQYRYKNIYPRAIEMVSEGLNDVKPLVSHRFTLEKGIDAFKAASDPKAMALKVQILDD